jgi:Zn-dependent protease
MGGAFKIGRVAGIDLKVHWTFFLLLAYFAFAGYQGSGSLTNALVTALVIVALFVCVVLHEYGHSLVAQRLGIELEATAPSVSCSGNPSGASRPASARGR